MENGYNNSIEAIFDKMEEFISSKTVVGEPISMGEVTLLPIIEVSVGVAAGGNLNSKDEKNASGGGMGAKIVPSAILVVMKDNVRLISVKNQDAINRLIDMVPNVVSKLDFGSSFNRRNNNEQKEEVKFDEKIIIE